MWLVVFKVVCSVITLLFVQSSFFSLFVWAEDLLREYASLGIVNYGTDLGVWFVQLTQGG